MSEHMSPIPSRIYNAAVGGHVCGPEDVDFGQKVVHLVKYDRAGNEVSFESQVTQANKIYVIHDDFTLSSNVTIPANCVLEFDGGSVSNSSGNSYLLTGTNTGIKAGLINIFSNIVVSGTWNVAEAYPEWFGAKGDGVTDDTAAIKNACALKGSSKLVFSPKTYIFNVTAGTDYTTQRTAIGRIYQGFVEGNNACLKLGNNNNCDIRAYKGFGKVFYVASIREFKVRNLTIDFNYDNNPIYHISSRSQSVEENTQQNAFQVRDVHNFIVENCTFIGHSGTNCIDFIMTDAWTKDDIYVKIDNCNFLKCGGVSYYDNNGVIETAAHDVSTCALHYRTTNAQHKYRLDFTNNYMEGVGINAFNALECSAHILNYTGNKIIGFASSVLPCTYGNDYSHTYITNNTFLKAKRPIRLWMIGYNDEVDITPAYDELVVKNNTAEIDIVYHDTIKDYFNIANEHGSLKYGLIDTNGGISRNFGGSFIIDSNIVKYVNIEEAKTLLSGVNVKSSTFDIYQVCVSNLTESKCELLQISNNYIINSNASLCRVATFSKITKFVLDKNTIINPFTLIDKATSILYFYLTGNTGVSGNGIGDVYITNTLIDNSEVVYDEGSYAIIDFNITPSIKENRVKVILGNRTTKPMPLTNLPGGTFVQSIVDERNADNSIVTPNTIPTYLTAKDFGTILYNKQSDWANLMFWNGSKFVNGIGQTTAMRMGIKAHRDDAATNVLSGSDKGFLFFDTNLNKPVFFNGTKFVNGDSSSADVKLSGTFAQKPSASDIYVGFKYFCTDKQTTEGATNGIEIIHKGNDVWVDALGRVVS